MGFSGYFADCPEWGRRLTSPTLPRRGVRKRILSLGGVSGMSQLLIAPPEKRRPKKKKQRECEFEHGATSVYFDTH